MVLLRIYKAQDSEEVNALISFSEGEHFVGSQSFSDRHDIRVPGKDALIRVREYEATLTAVGTYSCFYRLSTDNITRRTEKNVAVTLSDGDQFSLPFDMNWYKVKIILSSDDAIKSGTSQTKLIPMSPTKDVPKRSLHQGDSNLQYKRMKKTHYDTVVQTNINGIALNSLPKINAKSLIYTLNVNINKDYDSTKSTASVNQTSDHSNGNKSCNKKEHGVSRTQTTSIKIPNFNTDILVSNSIINEGCSVSNEEKCVTNKDVPHNSHTDTESPITGSECDHSILDDKQKYWTENSKNSTVSIIKRGENSQQFSSVQSTPHEITTENINHNVDKKSTNDASSENYFENLSVKSEPPDVDSAPNSPLPGDDVEEPILTQGDDTDGSCSRSDSDEEMERNQYLNGQICHSKQQPVEPASSKDVPTTSHRSPPPQVKVSGSFPVEPPTTLAPSNGDGQLVLSQGTGGAFHTVRSHIQNLKKKEEDLQRCIEESMANQENVSKQIAKYQKVKREAIAAISKLEAEQAQCNASMDRNRSVLEEIKNSLRSIQQDLFGI